MAENKDLRHNVPCAFEIDGRVKVYIDHDLAISLGSLILSTETKNSALLALAHQLKSLAQNKPVSKHDASEDLKG